MEKENTTAPFRDTTPQLSVLILAGGKSSRMGEPKHSVILQDGRPMIAHVLDALTPLNLPIHLSTPKTLSADPLLKSQPYPILQDEQEYQGPLVAIAHALQQIESNALLVVCCDQPLLTAELLQQLIETQAKPALTFFQNLKGESLAPFPGIFPVSVATEMIHAINEGERSPRRWLAMQNIKAISIDPSEEANLQSFNSPTDLQNLL